MQVDANLRYKIYFTLSTGLIASAFLYSFIRNSADSRHLHLVHVSSPALIPGSNFVSFVCLHDLNAWKRKRDQYLVQREMKHVCHVTHEK